jgi:hypothetical protein
MIDKIGEDFFRELTLIGQQYKGRERDQREAECRERLKERVLEMARMARRERMLTEEEFAQLTPGLKARWREMAAPDRPLTAQQKMKRDELVVSAAVIGFIVGGIITTWLT